MSFVDEHFSTLLRSLAASSHNLSAYKEKGKVTVEANSAAAESANHANDALGDKDSDGISNTRQRLMQRAFDISTQILAFQDNGSQLAGLVESSGPNGAVQTNESEDSRDPVQDRQFFDKRMVTSMKSPSIASVVSDLGLVRDMCSHQAANASEQAQNEAVNLVLVNSVAAIHAHTIGQLLDAVLPLSIDIDYWNSQDDGAVTLALYLLQSLPWRLAGWGSDIIDKIVGFVNGRRHGISELGNALYSSISTKQLFPDVMLPTAKDKGRIGVRAIAPLLRVPSSANVLSLTLREIRYKIKRLEDAQDLLAAMIGALSQAADTSSRSWPSKRTTSGAENIVFAMQQVEQVLNCVENGTLVDITENAHQSDTIISKIRLAEQLAIKTQTVSAQFTQRLERYRRPSLIARSWLPALILVFCARRLTSYIADNRENFKEWLLDGAATLQNYVTQYILAPLRSAYETIRYGKHSYSVVTQESLFSDFRSLEDMVVGFARRFGNVDAADIRRRVECGDLSDVMQVYAHEMQQPFKNAVFGDLVEAMLIQVQKVKVDVGQTMAALDKLLKSNELNFLLLSTVPATLSIYAAGRWISSKFAWWISGSSRYTISSICVVMRDIDRLLNNSSSSASNDETSNSETTLYTTSIAHGKLICFTHYLRHHAMSLPDSGATGKARVASGWVSTLPRTRSMFLQDVRDIESVALDSAQKRNVVDRMYRTFRFL